MTPVQNDCVVVFDERCDEQDVDAICDLASTLTAQLECAAWAVLNHDDDVLLYWLYVRGELVDEFNSAPDYFGEREPTEEPDAGNADKLCDALGSTNTAEVQRLLLQAADANDGYLFAVDLHEQLANALGIATYGIGVGYRYVCDGELPDELSEQDLIRVG